MPKLPHIHSPLHATLLAVAAVLLAASQTGCVPTGGRQEPRADSCWEKVQTPDLGSRSAELGGIVALSKDDVWAVGQASPAGSRSAGTLTLHWDGSRWSEVPSPNGSDAPQAVNNLYSVSGTGSKDVWAVGGFADDGAHFRSLAIHWNGREWLRSATMPNPGALDNTIYDVTSISESDVWAAGSFLASEQGDAHMMALHWNGQEWRRVETPAASTHNLLSVRAVSPDDIWAAGTQILQWDGREWRVVPTPADSVGGYLDGIAVAGTSDVWVVGNDGNDAVMLHYGGTGWTRIAVPGLDRGPYPHDVAALSPNDVWAAGEYADNPAERRLLLLHWDGTRWSEFTSEHAKTGTRLQSISAGGGYMWAAGTEEANGKGVPLIMHRAANCSSK